MPHPQGGRGNSFSTRNTFIKAFDSIGDHGCEFRSTTNALIFASRGWTSDGRNRTIAFKGHGNVCEACWGYRINCSGTRIGHCVEALDSSF